VAKRDAYVIMPFSSTVTLSADEWTETYEHVFAPAVIGAGYTCARAKPETGSLIGAIVRQLHTATVVLADVTDRNPNVFYELGVRHALSKRTIVVAQTPDALPSDLKGYWALAYARTPKGVSEFRQALKEILMKIESEPESSDNPVSDYLQRENATVQLYTQSANLRKLNALCTEMSGILVALQNIKFDARLLYFGCLSLLLDSMYIDPGVQILRVAYELRRVILALSALSEKS
jgi:hypothetical protein